MFLKNGWYCAGWVHELDAGPIARRMLDQPVLVFRAADGKAVAVQGRCPHRFAPLHRGTIANDTITCPYHGLVFDKAGHCIHNPHGDGELPKNADLQVYPVVENQGVVWVWLGNPAMAADTPVVDTGFVVDPGYATVFGYLSVEAHYQLIIDNLLDLTHPAILHVNSISSPEYMGKKMHHRFHQEGTVIHSDYLFKDVAASPGLAPLWGDRRSDVRAMMALHPPSSLMLDFRMNEVDGPMDQGLFLPTAHLLVPESETRTHYFYAMGRNAEIDNPGLSAIIAEVARKAFAEEDEPMIRECQEMMGTTDLFSLKPAMLQTDVAAVRARLLLDRLLAEEAAR